MAATRLDRRLTAAAIDDLPHEWDTRYELIEGVLYMSRRPSFDHQDVLTRLLLRIGPAVLERGGWAVPEPGIVWEIEGEDNVSPDLAIGFGGRPPRGEKLRTCPAILVEILSGGDENRRRDLDAKRALYWRRGAAEYWIVDPDRREILRLTRAANGWNEERLNAPARVSTPLIAGWSGFAVGELFD